MHAPESELTAKLKAAAAKVIVGGKYYHYKDVQKHYRVTGLALLEATEEVAVVYHAEYGDRLTFVRPLSSWLDTVMVDSIEVRRFNQISEPE